MSQFLRLSTPRKFLGLFDLRHGVELVLISVVVNKAAGVLGVISVLSADQITLTQLSMYFYSLAVFALLCYMIPRIHRREALSAISFAYLYLVDSVVNVVYTLLFAGSWFLTLAERDHAIAAASAQDLAVGNPVAANNATIAAVVSDAAATGIAAGVLQPESATSIMIIAISWTIRLYFVTVAFAFAREVVRASATESEGPFEGSNGGEGWQGRLGRALVGVGRGYWKGDGYATFGGSKFRRSSDPGDNGRRFRRNDRISMEV